MIYVHRDWSKVPEEKLSRLKALSEELEKIADKADRKAFIAANADAWSDVRGELEGMSFGKCWYTESCDPVSSGLIQTDGSLGEWQKSATSGALQGILLLRPNH